MKHAKKAQRTTVKDEEETSMNNTLTLTHIKSDQEELNLQDHLNSCRCCLKKAETDQTFSLITKPVKESFFELTKIQLIQRQDLSNLVCDHCQNDLDAFSSFRASLSDKQQRLYAARIKLEKNSSDLEFIETSTVFIKEEPEEILEFENHDSFIDDNSNISKTSDIQSFIPEPPPKKRQPRSDNVKPKTFDNEEHQKLNDKFKQLLKKNKDSYYIECPACLRPINRKSVRQHIDVFHFRMNKFPCDLCNYHAPRRRRLIVHLKTSHGLKVEDSESTNSKEKSKCKTCGIKVLNIRRHMVQVHNMKLEKMICDLCPFKADYKTSIDKHMKSHITRPTIKVKGGNFCCDFCGLEFNIRSLLNYHIQSQHMKVEKTLKCDLCNMLFSKQLILNKHRELHNSKTMPCEICGKLFTCLTNLRSHQYSHRDPNFACNFPGCDKKYSYEPHLKRHMKKHRNQRDHKCKICNKSYFCIKNLRFHVSSIHERLRFFCEVPGCGGSYTRREYYKKHALALHQNLGQTEMENLLEMIKVAQPQRKL